MAISGYDGADTLRRQRYKYRSFSRYSREQLAHSIQIVLSPVISKPLFRDNKHLHTNTDQCTDQQGFVFNSNSRKHQNTIEEAAIKILGSWVRSQTRSVARAITSQLRHHNCDTTITKIQANTELITTFTLAKTL